MTVSANFGSVSPASGWFDAGSVITINASAPSAVTGEQYVWNGWTGSGVGNYSGMANPANVTMNGPITETASWTYQVIPEFSSFVLLPLFIVASLLAAIVFKKRRNVAVPQWRVRQ